VAIIPGRFDSKFLVRSGFPARSFVTAFSFLGFRDGNIFQAFGLWRATYDRVAVRGEIRFFRGGLCDADE
jgi:hypothetical protein